MSFNSLFHRYGGVIVRGVHRGTVRGVLTPPPPWEADLKKKSPEPSYFSKFNFLPFPPYIGKLRTPLYNSDIYFISLFHRYGGAIVTFSDILSLYWWY